MYANNSPVRWYQTIHSINIEDLKVVDNSLYIPIMEKVKQTKASKHMKPLKFMPYIKEPKLCVVTHLTQYLKLTTPRRQCSSLFISYIKPYKLSPGIPSGGGAKK